MNAFFDMLERYSPSAWFQGGVTTRDNLEESRPSMWRMESRVVRKGIVGVAAAGLFAAGICMGSPEAPATVTPLDSFFAQAIAHGDAGFSEVPEGYWPKMIDRVRSAKTINEAAFADMESLI